MRMMLVQIDNLLKIIGQLKNNFHREGKITVEQKHEIEGEISTLKADYENSFDIIRDKISAHAQPLDLISLMDWWGSLDYSTIEILYGDAKTIQSLLETIDEVHFLNVPDYSQIVTNCDDLSSIPTISMSRLAMAETNTVAMIARHLSPEEKAQTIVSIVEFLSVDFGLTHLVNNPGTIFRRLVFDIGWMLAVIDLCSLIDNLFTDSQYDPSLLSYWNPDFQGLSRLQQLSQSRDQSLEADIRDVRNKFAAHIDSDKPLSHTYSQFEALDLSAVHAYAHHLVNGFLEACRDDIRTQAFAMQRTALQGAVEVANPGKPFAN